MSTGIGERIKRRRKELGLSQEELAKRMGLKSKTTICKVETGDDNLTTTIVKKYADALHTTPAYIMGWLEVESNPDEEERRAKALQLFELYAKASPEVQQAVETILKSSQQIP